MAWHVDDLKVSHEKEGVLDAFIGMMQNEFSKDASPSISRDEVQEYLGMTLDFSENGRVVVKMHSYVKNMLNDALHPWMGKRPPQPQLIYSSWTRKTQSCWAMIRKF